MDFDRPPLNQMEWCSSKEYQWIFKSARLDLSPSIIKNRHWLLAISLKNPLFSNQWISSALQTAKSFGGNVSVTLVDEPYVFTMAAISCTDNALSENMNKLSKIRAEQLTRIKRLINKSNIDANFILWQDMHDQTPKELIYELMDAFTVKKSKTRTLILKQVARALPSFIDNTNQEQLAEFFLHEAPVLINYYYKTSPGTIDIYPTQQAQFFWDLDIGILKNELPIASMLAHESQPHVYCYSARTSNIES